MASWMAGGLALAVLVSGCAEEKRQRDLARGEKKAAREDTSPEAREDKARRIAAVKREVERLRRQAETGLAQVKQLQDVNRTAEARRRGRLMAALPPKLKAKLKGRIRTLVLGLSSCYQRTLVVSPRLRHKAKLSFVIETTGKVSKVHLESSLPQSFRTCATSQVSGWTLLPVPQRIPYGPIQLWFTPGA